MPNTSYYFALFKRFQIIGHAASGISHGRVIGAPSGGFDLRNAHAVFGNSNRGALLGTTTNPADSPLWAALNAKVMGNTQVTVGAVTWPAMPLGDPLGWSDFQTAAPAPKLVDAFADWIIAGKIDDVPDSALATVPSALTANLDSGVTLFACSVAGDNGTRPGTVPQDFWASSLIFLVDPRTGDTANPTELAAADRFSVVAVVGNRGDASAGRLRYPQAGETDARIEAAAWVMVWNSGTSPAVQLPALSNLDATATSGVYEIFELLHGSYEVVGFRLDVQTAFDGLVRAIAASGADLGGLTPEQWVHAQGAHLCVKVLVRQDPDAWPTQGDTPFTDRRLAQKNLAPFAIDLSVSSPDPAIIWRNFMVGDVLRLAKRSHGVHRLHIRATGRMKSSHFYFAVPKRSFERWVARSARHGFDIIDPAKIPGQRGGPFADQVILAQSAKDAWLEVPSLGEEFLAMSLGISYSVRSLKPGPLGDIAVIQETAVNDKNRTTVGGFTLRASAHDPREDERKLAGTSDFATILKRRPR